MKGSHWPHMEYPEVFNAIVDEWIEKVGQKSRVSVKVEPQSEVAKGRHGVIDEL